ncbi:hypothetical protein IF1G_03596 [Cordyceps javanica]|uniref:Uncharacterized protein n=1 Tax=Cordyceps javanica TaxID=43265 RepID=A0A545V819_9HYPO|nr:hypothetical protein IF1G_03596 [Cordyceps javanica]
MRKGGWGSRLACSRRDTSLVWAPLLFFELRHVVFPSEVINPTPISYEDIKRIRRGVQRQLVQASGTYRCRECKTHTMNDSKRKRVHMQPNSTSKDDLSNAFLARRTRERSRLACTWPLVTTRIRIRNGPNYSVRDRVVPDYPSCIIR